MKLYAQQPTHLTPERLSHMYLFHDSVRLVYMPHLWSLGLVPLTRLFFLLVPSRLFLDLKLSTAVNAVLLLFAKAIIRENKV